MKTWTSFIAVAICCAAPALQAGTTASSKAPQYVQPAKGDGNVVFYSHDRRDGANYNALGWYHALNNDLSLSGLYTRAFVGVGQYEYVAPGLPDPNVTGTLFDSDVGLGYRQVMPHLVLGGFASLHVRDRNLSAIDPSNNVGTDWGVRFGLDATGSYGSLYYSAIGQISTINWAIWSRYRVGYKVGAFTFGPEFVFLNDSQFTERRFGGFVSVQLCQRFSVSGYFGSADYGSSRGGGGNTPYGGVGLSVTF